MRLADVGIDDGDGRAGEVVACRLRDECGFPAVALAYEKHFQATLRSDAPEKFRVGHGEPSVAVLNLRRRDDTLRGSLDQARLSSERRYE